MRLNLLLLFSCLFLYTKSQNKFSDTASTSVAYWKRGEVKSYLITHNKQKSIEGKLQPESNLSYVANITILDSTKDGYKIQWIFNLTDEFKAENPYLDGLLPAFEGMKLLYLTTETGVFKELLNWQEVRDSYIKMFEFGIEDKADSSFQENIRKTKDLFNSKEMVEATLINEIRMFHSPFGYEYSTQEKRSKIDIPNPFGSDEPLSGLEISKILQINSKDDYFNLSTKQLVDTIAIRQLFVSMFQKMDLPKEDLDKEINNVISSTRIDDAYEYLISIKSGWINKLNYSKSVHILNSQQSESYVFELKR